MQRRLLLILFAFLLATAACPLSAQTNENQWKQYSVPYAKAHQQVQNEIVKDPMLHSVPGQARESRSIEAPAPIIKRPDLKSAVTKEKPAEFIMPIAKLNAGNLKPAVRKALKVDSDLPAQVRKTGDLGLAVPRLNSGAADTQKSGKGNFKSSESIVAANTDDSLALVVLYNECNGINWTKKANWLTGSLDTWQGVTVESGRVVGLYLDDGSTSVGLIGPIPEELVNLTEIRDIRFTNNQLSGALPESWSALTNLQHIALGINQFTGTLPDSWSALINLDWIDVFVNQLTGTLPDSWSALVNLNILWLSGNQFTGTLPESWSAFVNMTEFSLQYNQLTGPLPGSWSSMVNLWITYLDHNQISGLPDLSPMDSLHKLYVANNLLDFGDIEPNIGVPKIEFSYCCQAPVGEAEIIYRYIGQEFRVSMTTGGSSNEYVWFKDGIEIPFSSGSEYVIPSVVNDDYGVYTCKITNTVATGLDLWSNPITLAVPIPPVNESDSLALVALYNQCNGINWTKKANWLTGRVDTWQGVTVEDQRVVELNLGDWVTPVGLTGSIPAELSDLTEIRILALNNNHLIGSLPNSWSVFVNLQGLDLQGNQFSGPLPESWSAMTQLIYLWPGFGQWTGTLPESWSEMANLTNLFMGGGLLTGTLPESWSALSNMRNIFIRGGNLTGSLPPSWSALINLQGLNLINNQLSGILPDEYSALVNLETINLDTNQFTGSMPESWSALVNLMDINLSNNQISGLPDLSTMIKLKHLLVENNWLDFGDIEPNIGVPKVEFLYCCQAPVGETATVNLSPGQEFRISVTTGGTSNQYAWFKDYVEIPSSSGSEYVIPSVVIDDYGIYTCRITNTVATGLELWSNPITLAPPTPPVNETDSLALVALYNQCNGINWTKRTNWLTGKVDTWQGVKVENQRVVELNLGVWGTSVGLTGTIPAELSNLTEIRVLALNNNQLTGSLPESWSALVNLQALDLQYSGFSGSLPENWSALTKLDYLSLGYANWTGTLPESWSSLVNLDLLFILNGQFTGTLPDSWSSLVNMRILFLSLNHLTGTLPASWSSLVKLEWLNLSGNQFTGPLPGSWSALVKMQNFDLSNNQLTGSFPLSWSALTDLTDLNLSINQFSGLPDLSAMTKLNNLYVESNLLDFGDIEPVIGLPNIQFSYSPQAPVGLPAILIKYPGQEFRISVSVSGISNRYQWYKDAAILSGSTGPEYLIPSVAPGDAGIYNCEITNTVATDLTLTSQPVTLEISDQTASRSRNLSAGWTWFSLNVDNPDMSIENVLGSLTLTEGDYIKNQTVSSTYYAGFGWFGELTQIDPLEMYKIKLSVAGTLVFEGFPIDPLTRPIAIQPGWNWIGYLPQNPNSITNALSGITPVENDYIKNQTTSSTFYGGFGWFGELADLSPLDGYMLKSSNAGTLTFPEPTSGTFTDVRDSKTYNWVKIGTQNWMAENLVYLPAVSPSTDGSDASPYCYVYGYEGSTVASAKATANYGTYGVLYNWPAALIVCPSGWHLPTDEEWKVLEKNQGLSNSDLDADGFRYSGAVGGKLKEADTSHWLSPNTGATNSSGFTALPGGYRDLLGFNSLGSYAYFWTASEYTSLYAWYRSLYNVLDGISHYVAYPYYGYSVRCLQNK